MPAPPLHHEGPPFLGGDEEGRKPLDPEAQAPEGDGRQRASLPAGLVAEEHEEHEGALEADRPQQQRRRVQAEEKREGQGSLGAPLPEEAIGEGGVDQVEAPHREAVDEHGLTKVLGVHEPRQRPIEHPRPDGVLLREVHVRRQARLRLDEEIVPRAQVLDHVADEGRVPERREAQKEDQAPGRGRRGQGGGEVSSRPRHRPRYESADARPRARSRASSSSGGTVRRSSASRPSEMRATMGGSPARRAAAKRSAPRRGWAMVTRVVGS